MKLLNSETYQNLAKAFAGECMARTRYEFIEYGARKEGYVALSEIIDKIVYNEFNHARLFYTAIQDASDKEIKNIEICGGFPFKEKWELAENLKLAAEDEKAEVELYPKFAAAAEKEGFTDIAELFKNIAKIEAEHQKTFETLYSKMSGGTLYKGEEKAIWKCGGCGNIVFSKEAPKVCPVCGANQGVFMLNMN